MKHFLPQTVIILGLVSFQLDAILKPIIPAVPANLSPKLKLLFDSFNTQIATQNCQRNEIVHLAHLYRVQSEVNQHIVRKPQPLELFQFVCDTLVTDKVFRMAWVGVPQESGGYVAAAVAGMSPEQQALLQACQADVDNGAWFINDISADNYQQSLPLPLQRLYEHSPFATIGGFPLCPETVGRWSRKSRTA